MKKVLLLIMFLTAALFAQTTQKIGYVDSQVILNPLPEAIKAQGELDALVSKWNASIDSMVTDLQTQYTNYQQQAESMTPDARKAKEQELVMKEQKVQQFRASKFQQPNGEYYRKNDQLLQPVKDRIMKGIEEAAKKEGLTFVFDKAGDVILLYADQTYDVTFTVLDMLKRGKK